ncbi:MAG: primosomal protein N' [Nitrospirales bacterium]|nr:MAG: primosomal protein N' [Nitrospirales bacterium]
MFADIVFPQRRYRVFTYRIPARLTGRVQVGSRVLVPLGRSSAQGLVFKLFQDFADQSLREGLSRYDLREVTAIVDEPSDSSLSPVLLQLANQVETYYLAPPGSGLRLVLPPVASNRVAKRIVLTEEGALARGHSRLSPDQSIVLTRLAKTPKGLTRATLLKAIEGNSSAIAGLKRRKFIQDIEWVRDAPEKTTASSIIQPTTFRFLPDSRTVVGERSLLFAHDTSSECESPWLTYVRKALSAQRYNEMLLDASRSIRESYLINVIQETLERQRTVLVLCPEVQQVSCLVDGLRSVMGARVAEYHGDLSPQVRSQVWQDIHDGGYDVVVGTRLAIFLPLQSIGVIWVEQEEDASFQDEQSPYYHARDVARMRARLESATLVLGSSHPSLETFHQLGHVDEANGGQDQNLRKPVNIDVVNLRDVEYGTILSRRMVDGIQQALEGKGRVVIFLNRKGFSRSLTCKDCGHVPHCTKCGVVLILYQKPARLRCSYCGAAHVPPMVCPKCQSVRIEASGYGTEQLEALIQKKFPDACVARFDRETIKTSLQEKTVLEDFHNKNISILIGTELLFHVETFPPVQFVGIPNADAGLHFPDFRSAERTYHRLLDAVGLLDEASASSEIILQTLLPTHYVIQSVTQQNPSIFYEEELRTRLALNYPPYAILVHLALSGRHSESVLQIAMTCREQLSAIDDGSGKKSGKQTGPSAVKTDNILGPLLSPHTTSPGLTRYVLIIKESDPTRSHELVKRLQKDLANRLKQERVTLEIKVNPINLQ